MNVTKTYSWDFKTYSIKASTKCSECGKPITKTFSFQKREDISPNKEDWEGLEKEKQEWLSETHVCSKCTKKKLVQERKDITQEFKDSFIRVNALYEDLKEYRNKIYDKQYTILEKIFPKLKDKILIAKNKEWVIKSIRTNRDRELEIYCYAVDSRYPWKICDRNLYILGKSKYSDTDRTWYALLDECIITDEDFNKRKKLLND